MEAFKNKLTSPLKPPNRQREILPTAKSRCVKEEPREDAYDWCNQRMLAFLRGSPRQFPLFAATEIQPGRGATESSQSAISGFGGVVSARTSKRSPGSGSGR